jgi:hypothetical protein
MCYDERRRSVEFVARPIAAEEADTPPYKSLSPTSCDSSPQSFENANLCSDDTQDVDRLGGGRRRGGCV